MKNKCNNFYELLKEIQEKKSEEDLLQFFTKVADYLFNHVAIQAGKTKFTFAEIEFYYHYCPVKILGLEINRVGHHPLGRY